MRRLYLRIYLGFLVILVTFAVLAGAAAWVGRVVSDDDFAEQSTLRSAMGYLLTRVVPADEAEPAVVRRTLETFAQRFQVDVSLYDSRLRLVAAAGRPVPLPRRWRREGAPSHHHPHGGYSRRFFFRLDDGRWLAARRKAIPAWSHWLPYWVPLWLGPLVLLAAAIAIGAWPLARGLSRRIERLQARVDELGAGSLSTRVEVEGRDEVARLAASFNRAAERIERLVDAQRHILAGASHELRTPLTRIRLAIELLDGDSERRAGIERDIAELDELIEELLTAARLDAPDAAGDAEPVDLLAILAEEGARVGIEVRGEPVTLTAVERLLRRLARNLLENAVRHGAGTAISAELARRGGPPSQAVLRVTNGGRPIPDHLRERIFEPFFRIETAAEGPHPSGTTAERGVGLGLVLVRRIAEHHGGRARLAESGPGGTTFEVVLPLT
ncbi:MAG: HAMP domain-containing sensor histidine kinase [Immundisolibacterales bacterium]|nr:HAMP domain-containing sensor histidine kinase [Immundisolibacterales bacterium]